MKFESVQKDLRTEILRRLGPPGKDPNEESAWERLFLPYNIPGRPDDIDPMAVKEYAKHLRVFGMKLKRRAVPRAAPTAMLERKRRLTYNLRLYSMKGARGGTRTHKVLGEPPDSRSGAYTKFRHTGTTIVTPFRGRDRTRRVDRQAYRVSSVSFWAVPRQAGSDRGGASFLRLSCRKNSISGQAQSRGEDFKLTHYRRFYLRRGGENANNAIGNGIYS